MKMKKMAVVLVMAGSSLAVMQTQAAGHSIYGGSGTVHFKGGVTDGACSLDSTSVDQTVALPIVKQSLLKTAGDEAGLTPFKIKFTDCDATVFHTAQVVFTGVSNGSPSESFSPVVTTTSAKDVGLQIKDWTGGLLRPGQASSVWTVPSSGDGEMDFTAFYKAGPNVTPGSFDATVNFNITYQ